MMHEYGASFRDVLHSIPYGYIKELQIAAKMRHLEDQMARYQLQYAKDPKKDIDALKKEKSRFEIERKAPDMHHSDALRKMGIVIKKFPNDGQHS